MRRSLSGRMKGGLVAGACGLAGAAAGIAGAAAAPSHSAATHPTRQAGAVWRPGHMRPAGFDGPAVHADEVVLNQAGTAFINATIDSGTVKSVDGQQLTITEGFGKVTYKDVTLTIPDKATVLRNFKSATLSDLKAGDHVHVHQSSDGTVVLADNGTVRPPFGPRDHDGRGWGPPPGAPAGAPGQPVPAQPPVSG